MKLLPLRTPEVFELVASWLARKENYQWLDFGGGRQAVTPALLKIMSQRDSHLMRVYTRPGTDIPIGIVGLNNVEPTFKTGTLWGVAGETSFHSRGYASIAASKLLGIAFRDLGLRAVNTWVVDHNPSLRSVERMGFRFIGRQRLCHCIDGRPYDRLLFDLLAQEHQELELDRRRHRLEPERRAQPVPEDHAAAPDRQRVVSTSMSEP
jgi:RimJ/RimL family protein N-acetyltransferase